MVGVALAGIGGSLLFLVLAYIAIVASPTPRGARHKGWLVLIEGADGRLSTSKAQWFMWTTVVAGSYVAIYAARALVGEGAPPNIPSNVLLALGFSTTTMATAKGVTTAYIAGGRVNKEPPPTAPNSQNIALVGGLLTDDQGITDLSKVQMLTWTIIAIGIYIYSLVTAVSAILGTPHQARGLPDIDASLMVLTGLSQGGYLGKKLTDMSSTAITLNCLVPNAAVSTARTRLVLYGANFGTGSPDSCVTINGKVVEFKDLVSWAPQKIAFQVGVVDPQGQPWDVTKSQAVGVVVEGQPSSSTLALTFTR